MPPDPHELFDPRTGAGPLGPTRGLPPRVPQVEVVTGEPPPLAPPRPPRGSLSLILWFLGAFALVAVPASLWNFTRPPVYRAAATVLTVVPAERSGAGGNDADLQHVAIQRQLLLGRGLLDETLRRVDAQHPASGLAVPDDLLPLLAVDPVPQTNLVEISASGAEPALLASVVNEWLAAYEDLRQREIESQVGDRLVRLDETAARLEQNIRAKRADIDAFRDRFDIVTLERDSNQAVRRLADLQAALAKAEEESIAARARAEALQAALANGELVVSERFQATLSTLRQQAAVLREQVKTLRERYTSMFIENDPNKRALPEQLAQVEAQIDTVLREGRAEAIQLARQEVDTTTGRVLALKRELADQKLMASRYSSGFAEYEELKADLAGLEEMQRNGQSERVGLESTALAGYPQVEVIEPAYPPRDPIRPHYLRDLWLTLLAATGLGLLTVLWLLFLDSQARGRRVPVPMTGVRVWGAEPMPAGGPHLPRHAGAGEIAWSPSGQPSPPVALPTAVPRQLLGGEVEALWDIAGAAERQLIGLLLIGVSVEEAARLVAADFDLDAGVVRLPAPSARSLGLPEPLRELLAAAAPLPAWAAGDDDPPGDDTPAMAELLHRIPLLASDAGIAHAHEVDAGTLRDTYLIYLIRQGARLTQIERIAGPMTSAELRRYAPYSPAGASRPLEQLDLTYPALA